MKPKLLYIQGDNYQTTAAIGTKLLMDTPFVLQAAAVKIGSSKESDNVPKQE